MYVLSRVGLWKCRAELRGSTSRSSRAPSVAKALRSSIPSVCMRHVHACPPGDGTGKFASHPHIPQLYQPSLSGAGGKQEMKARHLWVKDLQGPCRWSWCHQRLCLREHPAGRIHTLRKLLFQITGLLRWFMVSDFFNIYMKRQGKGRKTKNFNVKAF